VKELISLHLLPSMRKEICFHPILGLISNTGKKKKKGWRCGSYLLSKHEGLSSNPSTVKKKREKIINK
jgi:hypothetical protein